MKQCGCSLMVLLLSGCAATNTLSQMPLAQGQAYLAPLHVTVNDLKRASTLRNDLRETGVFSAIEADVGSEEDYSVHVQMEVKRQYPPYPLVLLSSATLFLLPLSREIGTDAEFTVSQGRKVLKRYRYRNNTQKYTFLLDMGAEVDVQNLNRIAHAFAHDVQQDHLIPVAGTTR